MRCREAVAVDRVNPETHEHYEVCLRCNAYRDRGRGAALPWFGHQIVLSAQRFLGSSPSCARVRTRRYSLPNSDNPNLHPMMNWMTKQTAPMIVAIIENLLALLECS